MAISFTTTIEGCSLIVTASGFDENVNEVQAYGLAIIRACVGNNVTHVMCDETQLEYRLGTVDTYQAATYIAAQAPNVARVALVTRPQSMADARFWETVVVNRGLTARVFADVASARAWLAQDTTSKRKEDSI
jgi:hypothetical protein